MAAEEQSAGVLIFRREGQKRLYLLLDYGKHWDYPKGHIEPGETPQAAAWRELKEETGIESEQIRQVPGFGEKITYFFRDKKKGLVRKSVIFYLAETEADQVTLSHEHVGFEFLPFDLAFTRLTFATARAVLRRAEEFLGKETERRADEET
jgi:8-oxo-dGTP pyrophosphatase MutT (NUDIX family)